jgi:hypothetical protein
VRCKQPLRASERWRAGRARSDLGRPIAALELAEHVQEALRVFVQGARQLLREVALGRRGHVGQVRGAVRAELVSEHVLERGGPRVAFV